jgi:hypothetical protein
MLTLGASYQLTENVTASLAWMHGFRNSIEGPILQIPGSSVRLDAQLDVLWFGVNVRFGGHKRKDGQAGSGSDSFTPPSPSEWSGPFVPAPPSAPSAVDSVMPTAGAAIGTTSSGDSSTSPPASQSP